MILERVKTYDSILRECAAAYFKAAPVLTRFLHQQQHFELLTRVLQPMQRN